MSHRVQLKWNPSGTKSAPLEPRSLTLPVDPELCLLGNFSKYPSLAKQNASQINWNCSVCSQEMHHGVVGTWFHSSYDWQVVEMNSCIPLGKIIYCLRKRYNTFLNIWQPYLHHTCLSLTPSICHDFIHWPFSFLCAGRKGGFFDKFCLYTLVILTLFFSTFAHYYIYIKQSKMVPQKSFGELPRSSTPRSLLTVSGWQPLLLRRLTTASITERSGVRGRWLPGAELWPPAKTASNN